MRILDQQVQTSDFITARHSGQQSNDAAAYSNRVPELQRGEQEPVGTPDSRPIQPKTSYEMTRVAGLDAVNRQYQVHKNPDQSHVTSHQKKALESYAENELLSRFDANSEFIGTIDLFA